MNKEKRIQELNILIDEYKELKNEAVIEQNYETAAFLREKEREYMKELNELNEEK